MEFFSRYCAIKGKVCEKEVRAVQERSCFIAYPFQPPFPDVASTLDTKLTALDYRMEVPKPARSAAGLLFCDVVCPMILGSKRVLGEVTVINHNVFFELGYAYGLGKTVHLLRNEGQQPQTTPFMESGFYLNEYGTPQQVIDRLFTAEDGDRYVSPFADCDAEEEKGTVAVLIPDQAHHQSVIRRSIVESIDAHGLSVVREGNAGVEILRRFEAVHRAEWVIGDLVSDDTVDPHLLNAETALLMGAALSLGKKLIILQQEPVGKPMIDLAGLLESYAGVDDIRRILGERLDVRAKPEIRALEADDEPDDRDAEDEAGLDRVTPTGESDQDIFEEMSGAMVAKEAPSEAPPLTEEAVTEEPPPVEPSPQLREQVNRIIVEQMGVTPEQLHPGTGLMSDLGMDDLDAVELVMALEEEFEIEIPDEEVEAMGLVMGGGSSSSGGGGGIFSFLGGNRDEETPAPPGGNLQQLHEYLARKIQ